MREFPFGALIEMGLLALVVWLFLVGVALAIIRFVLGAL